MNSQGRTGNELGKRRSSPQRNAKSPNRLHLVTGGPGCPDPVAVLDFASVGMVFFLQLHSKLIC